MKKMHMLFIAEVTLGICLLIAVIVVAINKNHNPADIDSGSSTPNSSNPSNHEAGKNDLTEDEVLEYDTLTYRTNTFMTAENDEKVKLSESAKQRLNFAIYAYSTNVQYDYGDDGKSFAYITLANLKSDYEALYGDNYNFDGDYESASASITENCPTSITVDNVICIKDIVDFPYSYSFNRPTITGQNNSYKITGTYQKIDNKDNDNAIDLKYFFEFKNSYLLDFIAPTET